MSYSPLHKDDDVRRVQESFERTATDLALFYGCSVGYARRLLRLALDPRPPIMILWVTCGRCGGQREVRVVRGSEYFCHVCGDCLGIGERMTFAG